MKQPANRVLIVEDEVLIAATIQIQLELKGYTVVGNAISYEEAVALNEQYQPDIILVDIRLSGEKTGIDFANHLRSLPHCPPFIYLTAQIDSRTLESAKYTLPAGYLSKPIQVNSLFAMLEIALHANQISAGTRGSVTVKDNGANHLISPSSIVYLKIDHVYVKIFLEDHRELVERTTLANFMERLNLPVFVQTHRSYVANLMHVTGYDSQNLYLDDVTLPISRSRRTELLQQLNRLTKINQ